MIPTRLSRIFRRRSKFMKTKNKPGPRQQQQQQPDPDQDGKAIRVQSMDMLLEACRTPMVVPIKLGRQRLEIELYRLTGQQEEERLDILRKVTPPPMPGTDKNRPEYDENNPQYIAKLMKQMRISRAVALYRACPILSKKGEFELRENASHEDICAMLERLLPEEVLAELHQVLMRPEILVADRANFTTAPDSRGS